MGRLQACSLSVFLVYGFSNMSLVLTNTSLYVDLVRYVLAGGITWITRAMRCPRRASKWVRERAQEVFVLRVSAGEALASQASLSGKLGQGCAQLFCARRESRQSEHFFGSFDVDDMRRRAGEHPSRATDAPE